MAHSHRGVDVVLHQILDLVGLIGDRYELIAAVSNDTDNCNYYDELQPRAATFRVSVNCIIVFIIQSSGLMTDHR